MFNTGKIKDELTIERVCLLMNIVPCNEINLKGEIFLDIMKHISQEKSPFNEFVLNDINR